MTGSIQGGLGCLGAAIGVGLVGFKAAEAVGRNPGAATKILVQGIIGAGLAVGVVAALKVGFDTWFASPTGFFREFYVTTGDASLIAVIVLALGIVIGLIGSAIGLGRFLRV